MATIAFGLDHVCGGGGHVRLTMQVDGGATRLLDYTADQIREDFTPEQIAEAALVVLRFRFRGMTRAQVRAALQAGVSITI